MTNREDPEPPAPRQLPLLFLDVDGVLNAFGAWPDIDRDPRTGLPGYSPRFRVASADGYMLVLNEDHRKWLAELEGLFEIVWTTMWRDRAPARFAQELGIGTTWPWLDFERHATHTISFRTGAGVGGYKFPGVVATAGDRPAVWIDDDLDAAHFDWAQERSAQGIPTLLVQPNPAEGWTRQQYEEVLAFGLAHQPDPA